MCACRWGGGGGGGERDWGLQVVQVQSVHDYCAWQCSYCTHLHHVLIHVHSCFHAVSDIVKQQGDILTVLTSLTSLIGSQGVAQPQNLPALQTPYIQTQYQPAPQLSPNQSIQQVNQPFIQTQNQSAPQQPAPQQPTPQMPLYMQPQQHQLPPGPNHEQSTRQVNHPSSSHVVNQLQPSQHVNQPTQSAAQSVHPYIPQSHQLAQNQPHAQQSQYQSTLNQNTFDDVNLSEDDCILIGNYLDSATASTGEESDYYSMIPPQTDSSDAAIYPVHSPTPPPLPPPLPSLPSRRWSSPVLSTTPKTPSIPPPPFQTPPKLKAIEQVLKDIPGTDMASLRMLAVSLARDAVFGREEWSKTSLSNRKGSELKEADKQKMDYVKTLVFSRVPKMSKVELELLWSQCRISLSKSAQALRTKAKKALVLN